MAKIKIESFVDASTVIEPEVAFEVLHVEETDRTLGGAPVIRVDGWEFVGDSDFRLEEQLTKWLTDSKTTFVYKGRLYQRIDKTPAFVAYFGLQAVADNGDGTWTVSGEKSRPSLNSAELIPLRLLSDAPGIPTKG
ncbi:hypothetical protein [Streptomyces sp. cg35]|uniref:hypothetical protein n=1 Tax=Streptomyces sp. cg35 TaxID=3421650 RepID=UPI003D16D771